MTAYRPLCALLFAGACMPSFVSAQVLRCVDAKGHVTYTNTAACPSSQRSSEVVPPLSEQEKAQQAAQYQQALERKRAMQQLQAERDAEQRKADAERAAAEAAQRPPAATPTPAPVIVQVPGTTTVAPGYGPLYPPRPPHARPPAHLPPPPNTQAEGYNCNVFRCYDGKGNTWERP